MKFNILLPLICISWLTSAQVLEQLAPSELKQKTVVTEPQTLYKGFFRSGMAVSYGTLDKIFNDKGKRVSLESNIWANSWLLFGWFTYGITDRLQVDLSIPYRNEVIYQSFRLEAPDLFTGNVEWKNKASGIGDISFTTAYQFLTETTTRPSLTAYVEATLPTGEKNPTDIINEREYKNPVGSGEPSINLTLRMRKIKFPYVYAVHASYRTFAGGEKIVDVTDPQEYSFKSGNNLSVGGYFFFHLNEWIAIRNSIDYFHSAEDKEKGVVSAPKSWSIQYYPGLSFQIKQFRIDQAVNVYLKGEMSPADPSYFIILQYMF